MLEKLYLNNKRKHFAKRKQDKEKNEEKRNRSIKEGERHKGSWFEKLSVIRIELILQDIKNILWGLPNSR